MVIKKQNQYSSNMMSWHHLGPLITACSALWLLRSGESDWIGPKPGWSDSPGEYSRLAGKNQDYVLYSDSSSHEERSSWKSSLVFCPFCHFGKPPNQLTWHSATHTEYWKCRWRKQEGTRMCQPWGPPKLTELVKSTMKNKTRISAFL